MFKSKRFNTALLVLILSMVQFYAPSVLPSEIVLSLQTFLTACIGYFAMTSTK